MFVEEYGVLALCRELNLHVLCPGVRLRPSQALKRTYWFRLCFGNVIKNIYVLTYFYW